MNTEQESSGPEFGGGVCVILIGPPLDESPKAGGLTAVVEAKKMPHGCQGKTREDRVGVIFWTKRNNGVETLAGCLAGSML